MQPEQVLAELVIADAHEGEGRMLTWGTSHLAVVDFGKHVLDCIIYIG